MLITEDVGRGLRNRAKPVKAEKPISRYARIDSIGRVARNSFEELRRELNMTQDIFGEKLGLSKQCIQFYETDRSFPKTNTWLKMKENARLNGFELSDDIFEDFTKKKMEVKKEMFERHFEKKKVELEETLKQRVDKINDRIKKKMDYFNEKINQCTINRGGE